MSDISLKGKDYLQIAKSIDINKNNIIDENEAITNLKGKVTTNILATSLQNNKATINKISKESADNVSTYLSDRFNRSVVINNFENKLIKFVDEDFDLKISNNEISNALVNGNIKIGKNVTINNLEISNLEKEFGKEDAQIINKFRKSDSFPMSNDYKSNIINAVISNTSSIEDFESNKIFNKQNYSIAADIFKIPEIKSNSELKSAITEFMKKIPETNKISLVSIDNIFKREPKLSQEDIKLIFQKLNEMTETKYPEEVGNSIDLAMSALNDVAIPTNISQASIGTCAGTSIQIQIALRNPIEYLNMLDTLAKKENYKTLSGKEVQPNFTFKDEKVGTDNDTERTISSKIMQNSIMDYSDSNERNYDSSKKDEGLNRYQTNVGLKDILNIDFDSNDLMTMTPKQIIQSLKDSKPDWSNPITISLSYDKSGRDSRHAVNVIGFADKDVKIVNPWGRVETFPTEELEKRILSISNTKEVSKIDRKIILDDIKDELQKETPDKSVFEKISIDKLYSFLDKIAKNPDSNNKLTDKEKIMILNIMNEVLNLSFEQIKDQSVYLNSINLNKNSLLNNLEIDKPVFLEVKNKLNYIDNVLNTPQQHIA